MHSDSEFHLIKCWRADLYFSSRSTWLACLSYHHKPLPYTLSSVLHVISTATQSLTWPELGMVAPAYYTLSTF